MPHRLSLLLAALLVGSSSPAPAATAPETPTFVLKFGGTGTGPARMMGPRYMATDALGNVYVSDLLNHRIQVFDRLGNVVRHFGSNGSGNGQFQNVSGVVVDRAGFIYVADANQNRIQKFGTSGGFVTSWGATGNGDGQLSQPLGLAVDAADNIYVVDSGNSRIQKFTKNGVFLGKWGTFGNGPGQLWGASDVAVDRNGYVYVANLGSNRVVKFTSTGSYVTHWSTAPGPIALSADPVGNVLVAGGTLVTRYSSTGALLGQWGTAGAGDGQFNYLYDIGIDAASNLYVADYGADRVQKFSSAGETNADRAPYQSRLWGGTGTTPGLLSFPRGIALDPSGNVYVGDASNHRVQKFGSGGQYISQWGSFGTGAGQFNSPAEITFSSAVQVLYVVDNQNHRIQLFTTAGTFVNIIGQQGAGAGQFQYPYGIASDNLTQVYVTDSGNHRVQKFSGTSYVTAWGSFGSGAGQFNNPMGIAVDAFGYVYVADNGNHRIQKFTSTGEYVAQWGSLGTNPGQFWSPVGVSVDAGGNVYVSDTGNDRIQKFNGSGHLLMLWGSTTMYQPWTSAIDGAGNVYVADTGNDRMVKYVSAPSIALISDVGNDQGRQVMLRVLRTSADAPLGDVTVTGYEIYRRNDPLPGPGSAAGAALVPGHEANLAGWTYLATIPAHGESEYNVVVPTLVDATATSLEFSAYLVRAATPAPLTFFDSTTDHGHSIDNLPPPVPAPFTAAYDAGATHLHWSASSAPDFATFRLHRGSSADFVPGPANLVAAQPDTGYADPGPAGSWYKLVAVDLNGNESPIAMVGPAQTTDAPGAPALEFALRGVSPNPARGDRLLVDFTLPMPAPARLELIDLGGRRVAAHDVGVLGAGRHQVDLARGRRLEPGIYMLRLQQEGREGVRRIAVIH